jgi:uncharacterized membrane protein
MNRVTLFGHSLHPMLVVFPLGLLVTSLVWDITYLASGNWMWATFAFWTIVAGLVGGVAAAIPGFIDWLAIPRGTRAFRVATMHFFLNAVVLALFGLSLALRLSEPSQAPTVGALAPGWIGIAVGAVSAWLGGELVQRLGVGIDEHPDVNAPSSLAHPPIPVRPAPPTRPNLSS